MRGEHSDLAWEDGPLRPASKETWRVSVQGSALVLARGSLRVTSALASHAAAREAAGWCQVPEDARTWHNPYACPLWDALLSLESERQTAQ